MTEKKIIAIVGATGAQGGGLVRAILNDQSSAFAARAITDYNNRTPFNPSIKIYYLRVYFR